MRGCHSLLAQEFKGKKNLSPSPVRILANDLNISTLRTRSVETNRISNSIY